MLPLRPTSPPKDIVTVEGSLVTGLVHSVMEAKSSNRRAGSSPSLPRRVSLPDRPGLPMASHRLNLGSNARDAPLPGVRHVCVSRASSCGPPQIAGLSGIERRRPYLGATNWPCSQRIVASDCIGSPSFTAVLSTCEQRGHSKVRRS
jgi:hypothetical protein